jgi:very-short-patch-repair endonuclease
MSNSKDFIPFRPDLKAKAQDQRRNPNKPEAKLWYEVLRDKQMLGYRFLRQKPILNYILDFYCHKLKLGIEVDGDSHSEQERYDKARTKELEGKGIKIIRYFNTDIMMHLDGVYWDIEKKIKEREMEIGLSSPLKGEKIRQMPDRGVLKDQ